MKVALVALFSLFTVYAHAEANSGLDCSMVYSTSSALSAYSVSSSGWLTPGSTLEGKALMTDGDGGNGTSPANYIEISKAKVDGNDFWSVKILDGEKNAIGVFSFPAEQGMKATLPVKAVDEGDEDPSTFDTLQVTCSYTVFAG